MVDEKTLRTRVDTTCKQVTRLYMSIDFVGLIGAKDLESITTDWPPKSPGNVMVQGSPCRADV